MRAATDTRRGCVRAGIVRINPAKSKHLETAVVSIFGHSVDLVNLRTESYRPGSRIPTVVVRRVVCAHAPRTCSPARCWGVVQGLGSPKQDCSRRDFTINALYYNIREDRIEDYTGHVRGDTLAPNNIVNTVNRFTNSLQGLADLEAGLLRTPDEPLATLLDDPLRCRTPPPPQRRVIRAD